MLLGELCTLRPIEIEDSETIRNWRLSEEVSYYFPSFEPISLQQQRDWMVRAMQDNTAHYFVICDKATSTPVGVIFLTSIDRQNQHAEFGYYLGDKRYQGAGIAIEAELLLLDYAFSIQNLHKVYCESLAYNEKVLSLHAKFGFNKDGVKREHIYKNGEWNDIVIMSVLKQDFLEIKGSITSILTGFTNR